MEIDQNNYTPTELGILKRLDKAISRKIYLRQELSLPWLAQQLNTNRTYMTNVVNKRYGIGFSRFISRLRVEDAKRLLLEKPTLSNRQLASELGFKDVCNFYRMFRMETGMTPGQWQKQNME